MLGSKTKFKKAKIPFRKNLKGRYVVLEPLNISKHSKDLYLNFSKDKKISYGNTYHMALLKIIYILKNG
jgi:hypothetical protein